MCPLEHKIAVSHLRSPTIHGAPTIHPPSSAKTSSITTHRVVSWRSRNRLSPQHRGAQGRRVVNGSAVLDDLALPVLISGPRDGRHACPAPVAERLGPSSRCPDPVFAEG